MRIVTCILLLFLTIPSACLCRAQDAVVNVADAKAPAELAKPSPELAPILAQGDAFVAAFNNKDAKAVAALWTLDGEFVDDSGRRFAGRDEIEKGYAEFFADDAAAKIHLTINSLRLVSRDTAIEDGQSVLEQTPGGIQLHGSYTAVHVKVDGKWLMASVRDAKIEVASAQESVTDLEFLIGTWVAEEHGNRAESVCRWVANGSFVERIYTTTHIDGTQTEGVQLIGWNPEVGHVQSWDFSSGGGHALGIWSPSDDGWTSEIRGFSGDGTPIASVNLLRKLDDNAYVWQSIQRSVAGIALPDTNEVVLKRSPTSH